MSVNKAVAAGSFAGSSVGIEFMNPKRVEEIFGIKAPTIRLWCRQRRVKHAKAGKLVLVDVDDLRAKLHRLEGGETFEDVLMGEQ